MQQGSGDEIKKFTAGFQAFGTIEDLMLSSVESLLWQDNCFVYNIQFLRQTPKWVVGLWMILFI